MRETRRCHNLDALARRLIELVDAAPPPLRGNVLHFLSPLPCSTLSSLFDDVSRCFAGAFNMLRIRLTNVDIFHKSFSFSFIFRGILQSPLDFGFVSGEFRVRFGFVSGSLLFYMFQFSLATSSVHVN